VKISSLQNLFHAQLSTLYQKREIDAIFYIYIHNKYNILKHHYYLNPDREIGFEDADLEMLAKGYPIQYVTEETTFCELSFKVNPSVLIPRPETEELVAMIINKQKGIPITLFSKSTLSSRKQKLLDIGTGSGAIAIALKKNIKNAEVWATDVSEKALETAKINAKNCEVNITFIQHDILKDDGVLLPDNLDIIVSNPPYIPLSERSNLHTNVVNCEPHEALFVPDENPLIFYKAIAQTAKKLLKKGGVLYFETYEKFHSELSVMLTEFDFKEITLGDDMNCKPRFISCKKL